MKNITYKIQTVLLSAILFACSGEEEYEPITNAVSATSNHLIREEYKYGDTGGNCSFYDVCLSQDKQKTGFLGWYGYGELSTLTVGELSIGGDWLWSENLNITKNNYDIVAAENGYFCYGNEKLSEESYRYFLYFVSSENRKAIKLEMPKPNGKEISCIYHIEKLGNGEYLVYLYAQDSYYYYAKFSMAANTVQLVSNYVPSAYYLAICSVIQSNDGYDIAGGRLMSSQEGDTVWVVARKIHLTASSANVVFNYPPVYYTGSSLGGTYSMYKDALAVHNGQMYLTYFDKNRNASILCIDYENGYSRWRKKVNTVPYKLIIDGGKIYVIGKGDYSNYSSKKTDGLFEELSSLNAYAAIDVLDINGNALHFHTFGSDKCYSGLNNALLNNSQLYLFGYSDEGYVRHDNDFIPSDGFKGWFFKINVEEDGWVLPKEW